MGILIMDARIGAALFLCCAVSGFPQTDQSPEVASHDTPVTFSSKVSLVMAPVVVRDKKGRAIGTLRNEDFQLFDKGKPQIISIFTIEKAMGARSHGRSRRWGWPLTGLWRRLRQTHFQRAGLLRICSTFVGCLSTGN